MSASKYVVMGVAGSGKTTLAQALADQLGWAFLDADDLHPAANITKMASGQPLTDQDRWPWLNAVAAWIDGHQHCVVACSALKRSYRGVLGRDGLTFVYLDVPRDELERRLQARSNHFMPAELLDSQLSTLEPPTSDEQSITIDPGPIVDQLRLLSERG